MTKREGCSELSTPPSDAKAMFDAFEKWWSAEQFPDRPISLMARNAFYAGWETRAVARSDTGCMSDADEKIAAGTHVLMPVKATGEMCEAIEGYYSNTVLFKNRRRDTEMKAACWGALMAYGAMVKLFKNAAPQGNKAGSTPSDSGAGSGNQSLSLKRVLLPNNPAGAAPKDWVTNATASKNAHR